MAGRFLDDLANFLQTDAARRSGASGEDVTLQDRRNEGRLIGGLLPPGLAPPAALGAGLAYEYGVKPGAQLLQSAGVPEWLIPEPFRHTGVSSEPGIMSGLRRSLELARGAAERTLPSR